jgi:hypothetical protein
MASVAEGFNFVKLISFNAVNYQQWLGKRKDDSAMRSQWATSQ